jgi:thiosulfate/3-mercaptopyruvate sulfurtransferase
MPVGSDPHSRFEAFAHPRRLVSSAWLASQLEAGASGLVVVESDEDPLLYATGHIPGAASVDWHTELNDPLVRDYVDGARFAQLMDRKGIGRDDTVVLYGDKNNWWAAYAFWVFGLFGHPDVRLLDGGRNLWLAEGRPIATAEVTRPAGRYPVVKRDDRTIRAFREDVLAHGHGVLVDIRSPEEYRGERVSAPDYPEEGALRAGHIPGAFNMPWARAVEPDGRFKTRTELEAVYLRELGMTVSDNVITYCRIGERSSHTWFVLTQLLGFPTVRNYDGSWTEWGNAVRVPIERDW